MRLKRDSLRLYLHPRRLDMLLPRKQRLLRRRRVLHRPEHVLPSRLGVSWTRYLCAWYREVRSWMYSRGICLLLESLLQVSFNEILFFSFSSSTWRWFENKSSRRQKADVGMTVLETFAPLRDVRGRLHAPLELSLLRSREEEAAAAAAAELPLPGVRLRLVVLVVVLEVVLVLVRLVPLLLAAVPVPVPEGVPGVEPLLALLVQLFPPAALVVALVQDLVLDLVEVRAPVALVATGE